MASAQADSEQKEAQQYWGYLFKSDRTGTDLLKNLLRGIHKIIASQEPSDSPDVTPSQLAHFYRSLNGNYDQLFLSTPPSTIAFIYKNLGCVHSMQPLPRTGDRYSDPVIPALKVEGWIIWQTIQLLLGPDEHAEFLRAAVKKWDVKNPETGEVFPKILPRSCFPPHPDAGMVDWYEGVSNRLRQEAEEQEHIRITTIEDRPDTPNDFRHHRKISSRHSNESALIDDSPPENSAIAYFRNPLFRTVDGRPGVLRSSSVRTSNRRRPPLSPRDSFVQRGKAVASTVQNVVKNVGSPHLWDGHAAKEKERENRRRKSFPDKHHYQEDLDDDDEPHPGHSSRRGSAQDTPPSDYHHHHSHNHHRGPSSARPSPTYYEPPTRQRRSHEQPGPREYFPPYFEDEEEVKRPRSDTHLHPRSASPVKAGFMPSVSPLFATHVASTSHRTDSRTGSRSRPMSRHSPDHSDSTRYSAEGSGSEVGGSRAAAYGPKARAQRFSEAPNVRVSSRKYDAQASYR